MLVVIGSAAVSGKRVGLDAWKQFVLLPLLCRIHIDENAPLSTPGDSYRCYAAYHKRLVPRSGNTRQPNGWWIAIGLSLAGRAVSLGDGGLVVAPRCLS